MKQVNLIIILILAIILTYSCDTENAKCFKNAGEMKEHTDNLISFETININSGFNVRLIQSSSYKIAIKAGKNLIPYIDYQIFGNSLHLTNNNRCDWLRDYEPINIEISFPNIKEININAASDIYSSDTLRLDYLSIDNRAGIFTTDLHIECDSLWFRSHAATGDYNFRGQSDYAYIYTVGNGYLRASQLVCNTMHIVHRSLGQSLINVVNLLMIEDIQHGKVELRHNCPHINYNDNDYGSLFEDIGCL